MRRNAKNVSLKSIFTFNILYYSTFNEYEYINLAFAQVQEFD